MTDYFYRHTDHFDGALRALDRREAPESRDLDDDYFRSLKPQDQDRETRDFAQSEPEIAWETLLDYLPKTKFLAAWRERDAIEMQRLVDVAMRDGLEDEINERQKEYEREVYR